MTFDKKIIMTDTTSVQLLFSDHDIVDFLFEDTPPDGVTVKNQGTLIQAGADSGGIFISVVIGFPVGVASGLVSNWIWEKLKKSGKPDTTINKSKIILNEEVVETFFKKTITRQYEEYREWNDDDK